MERRTFVAIAAVAPALAAPEWQFFTPEEAELVNALCDQIIPADKDPGARQAGVVHYIDRQLTGPLRRFAKTYRTSLPVFNQACQSAKGKRFQDLPFAEQTQFLEAIEKGPDKNLATLFNMVIDHTMQGFYGDPVHGGNDGAVSWKMMGIEHMMTGHHE